MRLLAPLTDRDFALLISGTLISMIGDGIYLVAITYATLTLSPGPGALSLVGAAMASGLVLFVVTGGVLADRHNKRLWVIWATLMQVRVPERMRGRVSSLDWLVSLALMPISFIVTAPIANLVGVRATLMGAGLLAFAATAGVYLSMPSLRAEDGGLARTQAEAV